MYENYISNKSTIKILDDFIKSGEKYFCIRDNFSFYYNDKFYVINFIISQIESNQEVLKSNITISDFKNFFKISRHKKLDQIINCLNHNKDGFKLTDIPKISLPVYDFIYTFYNIFTINIPNINNDNIIKFPTPITINAQLSIDKNYGYFRDGNHIFYGDTSQFLIIGYIVK